MNTASELSMTGGLILSAAWTALTGDTLAPSIVGASFAAYLRAQTKDHQLSWADIVVSVCVSIAVGVIGGPYFASQMPHGEGVVGVGALIASFMAVGGLTKLHALDWNMGDFLKEIVEALPGKKK